LGVQLLDEIGTNWGNSSKYRVWWRNKWKVRLGWVCSCWMRLAETGGTAVNIEFGVETLIEREKWKA